MTSFLSDHALRSSVFAIVITAMLIVDLVLFRGSHAAPSLRKAAGWSALWVAVAALFGAGVWLTLGAQAGAEFFTAYALEKTLSVDNVFVFVMIFGAFAVPPAHQQRVLFWGVLGAIVLRALFIALGSVLLAELHFVIYIFGAILLLTAVKLAFSKGDASPDANGLAVRALKRVIPVTAPQGRAFLARTPTGWAATPLLLALVVVSVTDVVFAVDSIPAVFAITRDPFIVLTSNIFAILGLRAMYFLLAGSVNRFVYLRYGLAVVLAFVGVKMCAAQVVTVPPLLSLGVIAAVLGLTIVASLWRTRRGAAQRGPAFGLLLFLSLTSAPNPAAASAARLERIVASETLSAPSKDAIVDAYFALYLANAELAWRGVILAKTKHLQEVLHAADGVHNEATVREELVSDEIDNMIALGRAQEAQRASREALEQLLASAAVGHLQSPLEFPALPVAEDELRLLAGRSEALTQAQRELTRLNAVSGRAPGEPVRWIGGVVTGVTLPSADAERSERALATRRMHALKDRIAALRAAVQREVADLAANREALHADLIIARAAAPNVVAKARQEIACASEGGCSFESALAAYREAVRMKRFWLHVHNDAARIERRAWSYSIQRNHHSIFN